MVPVQFDYQAFRFGSDIDKWLGSTVPDYRTYTIVINDEPLYKAYSDTVPLSRGPGRKANSEHERVRDVVYVTLCDQGESPMAQAWLAQTDLKGMVSSASGVCGVRLRCGNMAIGDGSALEQTFQKSNRRFAAYLVGEVHVTDEGLVPNARRDDFESNARRRSLMRALAVEISQPASDSIRKASRLRSKTRSVRKAEKIRAEAEKCARRGVATESKRKELVATLESTKTSLDEGDRKEGAEIERLEATMRTVQEEAVNIVDLELHGQYSKPTREALKSVFDMVHEDADDKARAEKLIRRIVKKLKTKKVR